MATIRLRGVWAKKEPDGGFAGRASGSGKKTPLFFGDRSRDGGVECFAPQAFANDHALLIEQVGHGDAGDAVLGSQLVFKPFAVEELGPGHFLLLGESR